MKKETGEKNALHRSFQMNFLQLLKDYFLVVLLCLSRDLAAHILSLTDFPAKDRLLVLPSFHKSPQIKYKTCLHLTCFTCFLFSFSCRVRSACSVFSITWMSYVIIQD